MISDGGVTIIMKQLVVENSTEREVDNLLCTEAKGRQKKTKRKQ